MSFDYINRKNLLIKNIKQRYPGKNGLLLLFSSFENNKYKFDQDSTFNYFTNLQHEPGVILAIEISDNPSKQTIYIPKYQESRSKWTRSDNISAKSMGVNNIEYLGKEVKGCSISPIFDKEQYENIINLLMQYKDHNIFTTYSKAYVEQYLLIKQIIQVVPQLEKNIIDISDIIAKMRRKKTQLEAEKIYEAVACTMIGYNTAGPFIAADVFEYEIQAGLELMFKQLGGQPAFPSIVASGSNGLILHYNSNNCKIPKDALVIIDSGAKLDNYCADITRTYPVSGKFSKRQKEIYNIVLETQEYIENLAQPGYWLNNKDEPNKSLHHLAYKFLEKCGYAKYFTHSIGHYLGLDVHDVGSYKEPLQEGDVFTIEPGLYIPEENIAVRIEDDYWLSPDDGTICLSEELEKTSEGVEEFMARKGDFDYNEDIDIYEDEE